MGNRVFDSSRNFVNRLDLLIGFQGFQVPDLEKKEKCGILSELFRNLQENMEHLPEQLKQEYPFEPHYLDVGQMRMHYVDEGKGPVVFLLHATPMWSFEYRKLITELSAEYRVIAPDLIGYGLSDKPGNYDYSLENHIANMEHLIDCLGISKASFVMHGWGATVGCAYLIRHPQTIEKAVIMNAMAFTGYSLPWRLRFFHFRSWLLERTFPGKKLFFSEVSKFPAVVREGYHFPFRTRRDRIALLRFAKDLPCVPEDKSYETIMEIEQGLWQLRDYPVMILWAGKDWLYPEKCLQRWIKLCPAAKIRRIARSGHFLTEDVSQEFLQTVSSFLKAYRS